jgi:hypothetical protein
MIVFWVQWQPVLGMGRERGVNERDSNIGDGTGQTEPPSRTLTFASVATILRFFLFVEKGWRMGKKGWRRIYAEG